MKLKVLIQAESEGGYSVSVPALPGCYSEGETLDEVLSNTREAITLWLESASRIAISQRGEGETGVEFHEIEV